MQETSDGEERELAVVEADFEDYIDGQLLAGGNRNGSGASRDTPRSASTTRRT